MFLCDAWAAGLFEGEGCINIMSTNGESRNVIRLDLSMTDKDVVQAFAEWAGGEMTLRPDRRTNRQPCYRWTSTANIVAIDLLDRMMPYFGQRRKAKALEAVEAIRQHMQPRGNGHDSRRRPIRDRAERFLDKHAPH